MYKYITMYEYVPLIGAAAAAHLETHERLQVPDAEGAHGAQADELLVRLVHGHVDDGEHVSDEAPDGPVPEVRVPHADRLVLPAGEHHVGRRAVLQRVAALRDPRVAQAAAARVNPSAVRMPYAAQVSNQIRSV